MSNVGRARERSETAGFIKVLVDGDSEQILGAAILGINGDEVVQTLLTAMYAGVPYTGAADFNVQLFDAEFGGSAVGPFLAFGAIPVNDGLFTLDLDFGVGAFDGHRRWLEIETRVPAGVGGYTTLNPRYPIAGTPYAIQTRGLFVNDAEDLHTIPDPK